MVLSLSLLNLTPQKRRTKAAFCPVWNTGTLVVLQTELRWGYIRTEQLFIIALLFGGWFRQ